MGDQQWKATSSEFPRTVRDLFSRFSNDDGTPCDADNKALAAAAGFTATSVAGDATGEVGRDMLVSGASGGGGHEGIEKRLEYDLTGAPVLTADDVVPIVDQLDCRIVCTEYKDNLLMILCDRAAIIITTSKLILTCNANIPVHKVFQPLLNLVLIHGGQVDWASFVRKNHCAPWALAATQYSDSGEEQQEAMSPKRRQHEEYAELKEAFPEGNSYLLGPLDADHYFYFLYDAFTSSAKELQVNMMMHDVAVNDDVISKYGLRATVKSGGVLQQCLTTGPGLYELMRVVVNDEAHLSFETNATSVVHNNRIQDLIVEMQPSTFSLKYLVDPQCPVSGSIAHKPLEFPGYASESHTLNEFAGGYVANKTTYTRL